MLRLIETEAKRLLDILFKRMILISQRQFSSVRLHQYLKLFNGDTPFGHEALKSGVIRVIESDTLALAFEYFEDDKTPFVEVINNQFCSSQPIKGTEAYIITEAGTSGFLFHTIGGLGVKIADPKNLSRICKYCLFTWYSTQNKHPLTKTHSSYQDEWRSKKNR